MPDLDLAAVEARYAAALDARPSKGVEIGSAGYTALTDAVADIPALVEAVRTAPDIDLDLRGPAILQTPVHIEWEAAGGIVELTFHRHGTEVVFRPGKPHYGGRRQVAEVGLTDLFEAMRHARAVADLVTAGDPVQFAAYAPRPDDPPF